MENVLTVEPREPNGKSSARKLRSTGKIPGVLYGHKEKALAFSVDPTVLRKHVASSGFGRNTVLKIAGLERECLALVKDTQVHPLKRSLVHIDLVEVRDTDRVTVEVPIEYAGKPKGVVDGGLFQPIRRAVLVHTTPLTIPKLISVDVSHMEIGSALHVRDIQFPEGTSPALAGEATLATLVAPMAEEAPTAGAAEAAAVPAAEAAPKKE